MTLRRPALALAACLALVPAAAACGGSSASDEEQIQDAVSGFYTAFAAGDGEKACSYMSENSKDALLKSTKALNVKSCEEGIKAAAGFLPTKLRDQIKKIEATDIKIDGDKATANAKPSVNNAKILFVKEDGDWKLDTDTKVS